MSHRNFDDDCTLNVTAPPQNAARIVQGVEGRMQRVVVQAAKDRLHLTASSGQNVVAREHF